MVSFNGKLLIEAAARRLVAQGFSVAVSAPGSSGSSGWAATHGYPALSDDPAHPVGPLAGVMTGLVWAQSFGAQTLVTTPCDTPRLPDDLETLLLASLTPGADAAVARGPSGLHSLCAAWRVEPALSALARHFKAGRHPPVHDLLAELCAVEAAFPSDAPFANLNTWDDVAQAEQ